MTIHSIVQYIYSRSLQQIVLWMFLAVFLWGIMGFVLKNRAWFRRLNRFLLLMFILVVFYITVISRAGGVRELVLIPFYSFAEAKSQPEMYRTMLMNVFLFLPVGLCLPFSLPVKAEKKEMRTILVAILFSVALELIQYFFGLGRCETDDVLMNALGAGIGSLSYSAACLLEKMYLRLFNGR